MNTNFKQSMRWIHLWIGLITGWLLYAVFVTGTSAYYRDEISDWMKPELIQSKSSANSHIIAMQKANELVQNKIQNFYISLPNKKNKNDYIRISSREVPTSGKRGWITTNYDATTGEAITTRDTLGGNFLNRFHFELYGVPRTIGRTIISIATMGMFIAILTGIFFHTRIFKDMFVFRPKKGIRNWMDGHILTSVAALPFVIMISYSGLLLLNNSIMPWAMKFHYNDFKEYRSDYSKLSNPPTTIIKNVNNTETLSIYKKDNLITIYNKAQEILPNNIGTFVGSYNKQRDSYDIRIYAKNSDTIFRSKSLIYDIKTTNLIQDIPSINTSSAVLITNSTFKALHEAKFSNQPTRFLFFILGVTGTLMIATGLIIWTKKRQKKYENKNHIGYKIVEKLNIGTILGLPLAICAYFISNKLIPFDYEDRKYLEVGAFFTVWFLSYMHSFFTKVNFAWKQQLLLCAILSFSIVLIDIVLYNFSLFDIFFIVVGTMFFLLFYKKSRKIEE